MANSASEAHEVVLEVATPADAALLSNLLELYIHDLSEVFPNVELGTNGRFGYDKLPRYWSEPGQRFAFIIKCGARVAGFVLATREVVVPDAPDVFDIAEFFVLRQFRRSGVGSRAAALLWTRLPGTWTVRVSEGNRGALSFWARTISEFTGSAPTAQIRPGNPHAWRVFSFAEAQIHVVPYDGNWIAMFEAERASLERILEPWRRGPIEHVGSTAVPGLCAKPVIDIMVGVPSLAESEPAKGALREIGYQYAAYKTDVMHWFCKPSFARRTHHLHLIPFQSSLWHEHLAFRDALRTRPNLAAEYAALKQELAHKFALDREAYTDAKYPFIARVLERYGSGEAAG